MLKYRSHADGSSMGGLCEIAAAAAAAAWLANGGNVGAGGRGGTPGGGDVGCSKGRNARQRLAYSTRCMHRRQVACTCQWQCPVSFS